MNDERNAYNNTIFLHLLKATHTNAENSNCTSPNPTCIIKCNMKYSSGSKEGGFNKTMYNRLLDECGDSDITNGSGAFVDPALNFFIIYH